MIDTIVDIYGNERRLGSLRVPENFVSAFPTFEAVFEVWDDKQIRRVISDPNRMPRRRLFGDKWMMDQKSHGSCNGFASAGVYSKCRKLRGINDDLLFSGAFAYSLMNGGQDNGSALEDGIKKLLSDGLCLATTVTWDMIYPQQQPSHAKAEAAEHKGFIAYPCETIQGLRTGLAKGFPAVVAVHAGKRFQTLNSSGVAGVTDGGGNHAVHVDDLCLVGGKEVYDMANSWNLSYGTRGRAYLTESHFAQTFKRHKFYLCASTQEADL